MCNPSSKTTDKNKNGSHRGVLYGSLSVFISIMGAAITFPFLQAQRDKLGCDAICYGSMMSIRSGLSLVGAFLVGRMSDKFGRSNILYVGLLSSLLSYMLSWRGTSITEMWAALIPSSLFNQNFSVLKALFADYNAELGGCESERAAAMGRLGMAVGVAFMLGPLIGATLLSNYTDAISLAFILTIISGGFILLLPTPKTKEIISSTKDNQTNFIWSFLTLPVAGTSGARLLFLMRLMMALAFNIYMTAWTVSVKDRFNFGPKEHAYLMGWVGLWYALSQGVLAKYFIKLAGEDSTPVLLLCIAWLSFGRVAAMLATSIVAVYLIMAVVIVALGVMNTSMSSACSQLADADQVGGLFGIMETIENFAGLAGPFLGGVLFKLGTSFVLTVVVSLYAIVFLAVFLYYRNIFVVNKHRVRVPSGIFDGNTMLFLSASGKWKPSEENNNKLKNQ